MLKVKTFNFFVVLLTFSFLLLTYANAEPGAGQTELAVARGCLLYDSGRLKEALEEFQAVLSKDPANEAAMEYVNKIWSRIYENGTSRWDLAEEIRGYRNALLARKNIEITDQKKYISEAKDQPYERFINTLSIGYNDREFEESSDKSFSSDGLFIAERIRMDTAFKDNWRNTFSLDSRYHDNDYEDARVRRMTYAVSNPGGLQFVAGDTSTSLSRYTLRGLYYRGVNLSLASDINEFKILFGAVPHLLTKTSERLNTDAGYIHPRKIFAAREACRITEDYKVGVSFMELRDSERVRVIDGNYNPKLNDVLAVDQHIAVVPDKWKIQTETAYSISDEDRTDKDILIKDDKLKDLAHYIRSTIEIPKFRLINSFERIGSDFRSYADLASTNVTWLAGIISDREMIDNYLEYRPFDFDPVYLDLYYSRLRSNLDKDNDIEMNRQANYGGAVRFTPDDCDWLPRGAMRLKFIDTLGTPGSQYASNDVTDRDIIFELAKRLYGIDLNTSYTNRKTLDNIETWGTYTNIYNIRLAKELTDMVLLSTDYSRSNTQKDRDGEEGTVGREDFFNINTALRLWAGANLSLGYSYENATDSTGIIGDTQTDTYSATFSWPFSKYYLKNGSELIMSPYLTYQLASGETNASKNRYIWTANLDATYAIAQDHRISMNASYREDQNHYENISTDSSSTQTTDYRFLLTYQKVL